MTSKLQARADLLKTQLGLLYSEVDNFHEVDEARRSHIEHLLFEKKTLGQRAQSDEARRAGRIADLESELEQLARSGENLRSSAELALHKSELEESLHKLQVEQAQHRQALDTRTTALQGVLKEALARHQELGAAICQQREQAEAEEQRWAVVLEAEQTRSELLRQRLAEAEQSRQATEAAERDNIDELLADLDAERNSLREHVEEGERVQERIASVERHLEKLKSTVKSLHNLLNHAVQDAEEKQGASGASRGALDFEQDHIDQAIGESGALRPVSTPSQDNAHATHDSGADDLEAEPRAILLDETADPAPVEGHISLVADDPPPAPAVLGPEQPRRQTNGPPLPAPPAEETPPAPEGPVARQVPVVCDPLLATLSPEKPQTEPVAVPAGPIAPPDPTSVEVSEENLPRLSRDAFCDLILGGRSFAPTDKFGRVTVVEGPLARLTTIIERSRNVDDIRRVAPRANLHMVVSRMFLFYLEGLIKLDGEEVVA